MRERLKRALPYLGYPAFFFGCFLIFCYFTFPYDRLRDYIVHKIEYRELPGGRLEPTGYHVTIVELSPYYLSGVEIQGMRIITQPTTPMGTPTDTSIPAVTARVSILPLIVGTIDVGFDVEAGGGTIEGSYATSFDQTSTSFDVTLSEVNLRALPILKEAASLPMRGFVTGQVQIDAPEERNAISGLVDVTIRRLEIGDGTSKLPLPGLPGGLTIEPIRAGDTHVRIEIARSEGTVRRFDARGQDVEMSGSGMVHFQQPLTASRIDLLLRARFTDAYRNKSDRTRTMLGMLDTNPMLRRARTSDGWLQVRLRGSPAVRIVPTPAGDERPPGRR